MRAIPLGELLLTRLDDPEHAGLPAHRIAQMGIGRSYQRTTIFPSFTVLENCRLAAQARWQKPLAWLSAAATCADSTAAAREACSSTIWKPRARCA